MVKNTDALIIMSAIVPTVGHKALIDFATKLADNVYVLIHARSWEPVSANDRMQALESEFSHMYPKHVDVWALQDDDGPEEDDGTPEFWDYWRNVIDEEYALDFDYVVGSEKWLPKLAEVIGAVPMPFDVRRETNLARGTTVRSDMTAHWQEILPGYRELIPTKRYVLFGTESVGKTTIGKMITDDFNNHLNIPTKFYPEWARQYLETVGPELTTENMRGIVDGQFALQQMVEGINHVQAFLDTDLFTTVGYYGILKRDKNPIYSAEDHRYCIEKALASPQADMYYLLPDNFPMTPDPLRYGVDHRETDTSYWRRLLQEYELPFVEVPEGRMNYKAKRILDDVYGEVIEYFRPIQEYDRRTMWKKK